MATDREIEGTPAEATWAMITVLIIIIVVLIFCCLLPFYRALEKRWHHWDDLGNDPRWDVENFQFSPTSPQLNPKYNRLSVCSTDNASSLGTSSSGVNRGDSFRNTCVMPRFPDQVEFKLPPSYDDLFSKGPKIEEDGTPPPYSITNTTDTEELIKDKDTEEILMPALAPQAKKIFDKPQSKLTPTSTPPVATNPPTTQEKTQSVSAAQDKKVQKKAPASSTPKTQNKNINIVAQTQARPATKSVKKTGTIPSSLAKTNTKNVQPTVTQTSSKPTGPPVKKTNSTIITKPTPPTVQSQPTSSQPAKAAPVPPVKKTFKKIKKTLPLGEK